MPSNTGSGIESSCSRNASISSIRKSLPPKGVKDGERESIIRSEVEVGLPLSEISRESLSITNFEGHGFGHRVRVIFLCDIDKARAVLKKGLPKIRGTRGSATLRQGNTLRVVIALHHLSALEMVLLEETPSSKLKRYHKIGLNTQWCSGTGAGKIELEKSGGVDLGFVVLAGRKIVIISKQGSSHVRSIDGALFKHIRAAHSGKNGKKHKLNGRTREFGTLHRRSDLVEISDVHLDLLRDALSAIFGLSELKSSDDDNDDDDVKKDEEDEEEEEHLASADPSTVPTDDPAGITEFAAALPSSSPPPENVESLKDNIRETMTTVNQGMSVEEIEQVVAQRVANAIEAIAIYETKTNMAPALFLNARLRTRGVGLTFQGTSRNQKQPNKRQNTGKAYAKTGRRKNSGAGLRRCVLNATSSMMSCSSKCHRCNIVGHLVRNCRRPTNDNTINHQRGTGTSQKANCYECGNQGHYKRDCPERKNRNHENQTRGARARGAVHALREGETDQDPNNIKDEIKA
ncbi:putative reverse transcriptase domain-containing protein [Tanacetum coccineum]